MSFPFKLSVTGSVVGKSQKMQLRDKAFAAHTYTSGELTFSIFHLYPKFPPKIYIFHHALEFIDKMESNSLWING